VSARGEVLKIETVGDAVRVTAQLRRKADAQWRPWRTLVIDMADHEARHYRVGGRISVEVRP